MALTIDPKDRETGLVWHDPALATAEATHVLIVGVGQFSAPGLAALSSTPAAARALAGWFLDGATGRAEGFANPARPLGSLAILLSEHDAGALSQLEGGPVPRASFANVEKALDAWVTRGERNPGSATVLAIFSHGQAERRRTAVLFEDYGTQPRKPYAGMTEADQLVKALSTFAPRDKLVIFDCCRMQVDLQLPFQDDFGTPLIGGQSGAVQSAPQVIMSTQYDGLGYGGKTGRPTLFAMALLEALRGCAADTGNYWAVNSRRLGEITERILGLWRKDGERLQVPETQFSQAFTLTQVPESDRLTLYVTLTEDHDFRATKFVLYQGDDTVCEVDGSAGIDPFARIVMAAGRPHRLVASEIDSGAVIGETTLSLFPPVAFRELPVAAGGPLVRAERPTPVAAPPPASPAPVPMPLPEMIANSAAPAAPVTVRRDGLAGPALIAFSRIGAGGLLGRGASERFVMVPAEDGERGIDLPAGRWSVDLRRPGLPPKRRQVEVGPGDRVSIALPPRPSGHEWLTGAVAAGVLGAAPRHSDGAALAPPEVKVVVRTSPDDPVGLTPVAGDARFVLLRAEEGAAERFAAEPQRAPVWVEVSGRDAADRPWREQAFVPLQGRAVRDGASFRAAPDPWEVELLVDAQPPNRAAHLAPYALSRQWGPMLAFLARRDFSEAAEALEALGPEAVQAVLHGPAANPLAAVCCALVALATGQPQILAPRNPAPAEPWLEALCRLFPTLPDGAVILARDRVRRGLDATDLLDAAMARGVPVTSLAVDWLAEALQSSQHPLADAARKTAMSCDPTRVFTVLQLPAEAP